MDVIITIYRWGNRLTNPFFLSIAFSTNPSSMMVCVIDQALQFVNYVVLLEPAKIQFSHKSHSSCVFLNYLVSALYRDGDLFTCSFVSEIIVWYQKGWVCMETSKYEWFCFLQLFPIDPSIHFMIFMKTIPKAILTVEGHCEWCACRKRPVGGNMGGVVLKVLQFVKWKIVTSLPVSYIEKIRWTFHKN